MKNIYNTKQKNMILDYLKTTKAHTTAAQIVYALKEKGEVIGTATVYRQLEKMVSAGIVRKYITNTSACFQYSGEECTNHFHLKCNLCGTLFHVDCDFLEELAPHILEHHRFVVDNHRTVVYGTCEKCLEEKNNG